MQAAQPVIPVAPVVTTGWPNILPGPFILLLMLPALPLLLFSIGARPPDTHSLPFSTDDLWQTTALITVAGAVVLCMGLYPGLLGDVGAWVKGDNRTGGKPFYAYFTSGSKEIDDGIKGKSWSKQSQSNYRQPNRAYDPAYNDRYQHSGNYQQPPVAQPKVPQMRARYEDIPRQPDRIEHIPESYRQDKNGNVYHRPASKRVIPGEGGGKRLVWEPVDPVSAPSIDPNSHTSVGARHLSALRNSYLKPWYSSQRPSLALGLIIGIALIGLLIIITGKILHSAYDIDKAVAKVSSKGEDVEAWYIRELQKRKKEKPEETLKRDKAQEAAFVGKLKNMNGKMREKEVGKRKKEIEMLKKELTKRKMPIVGLKWDFEGGKKKKSGTGEKIKNLVGRGSDSKSDKGDSKKKEEGGKEPGKLKKMLLGPLASVPPKDTSVSTPKRSATMTLPKEGGPGWKPADDAVAHAAIRGGAARAENLANTLVQQKAT